MKHATRKPQPGAGPLKDERATAVLARYSTTLLQAALLDRAMDRDQAEIDRLENAIAAIEKRNEGRLVERARLRAQLEREAREGTTP
ncbi:MAG: hypothetical protein HZA93_24125 [Verrucomicrobia bacterium]|nr:hypothetical protein [Verrucomicrobiota bacterium]